MGLLILSGHRNELLVSTNPLAINSNSVTQAEADARLSARVPLPMAAVSSSSLGVTTHQVASSSADAPAAAADWTASARSKSGRALSASEITDDALITVDGVQAEVRSFIRSGELTRDASGKLVMGKSAADHTADAKAKAETDARVSAHQDTVAAAKAEAVAPEVEAELTKVVNATNPVAQSRYIEAVLSGRDVSPSLVTEMANSMGVAPDTITGVADRFQAALENQIASKVEDAGLDFDAFSQWAQDNHGKELAAAVRTHVYDRSTRDYAPLIAKYTAALADSDTGRAQIVEACKASGIAARVVGNNVILSIPGHGNYPYAEAVRQGLIKVGG